MDIICDSLMVDTCLAGLSDNRHCSLVSVDDFCAGRLLCYFLLCYHDFDNRVDPLVTEWTCRIV